MYGLSLKKQTLSASASRKHHTLCVEACDDFPLDLWSHPDLAMTPGAELVFVGLS